MYFKICHLDVHGNFFLPLTKLQCSSTHTSLGAINIFHEYAIQQDVHVWFFHILRRFLWLMCIVTQV